MKRRSIVQLGLGLAAGGWGASASAQAAATAQPLGGANAPAALQWRSRTLGAMGTTMALRLAHTDGAHAERALDAAVADIRHVEDLMSLFRPDSAICELNRTGCLRQPPPDLVDILRTAQTVAAHSQGAFDVTVQPLWLAYASAQRQGRLPTRQAVQAARQRVGWRGLIVSETEIRLARPGMAITLNGIAQGYAADKVKTRLQSLGIAHALIDAGEWASLGSPDHAGDWTLGLADPRQAQHMLTGIALQGQCVATSADDQTRFSPDGANHHIFNPHTGYSPPDVACVAVAAPRCVLADALTKVFFMAPPRQALALARRWDVQVLVVDKRGHWQASAGLPLRAV